MSKEKNYILRIWLLLLGVVLALVACYYLPSSIGDWELKQIDLLSQIRIPQQHNLGADPEELLNLPPKLSSSQYKGEQVISATQTSSQSKRSSIGEKQQARIDSLYQKSLERSGVEHDTTFVAIEDYTAGRTSLARFYYALENRSSLDRPVRIAVLGDSFIEGDIFTGPLRKLLQNKYGGGGVGWMPLSSTTAGFRSSVRHEFEGWRDYSVLASSKAKQTFSGHYFSGSGGAWVRYTLPQGSPKFTDVYLYYMAKSNGSIQVSGVDTTYTHTFDASERMERMQLAHKPGAKVKISLTDGVSGLSLYGIALEGHRGVVVDNMSLRGNSGNTLVGIDESLSTQFCELRQYDLIILQYGLNVANDKQQDYSNYAKTLRVAIAKLRKVSPNSDILIMSVSDRGRKSADGVETMKSIYYLHRTQQEVAEATGCAFWSTLKAMRAYGGIGSMARKGQAAKDYTHLTHKGGVDVAHQFVKALLAEQTFRGQIGK